MKLALVMKRAFSKLSPTNILKFKISTKFSNFSIFRKIFQKVNPYPYFFGPSPSAIPGTKIHSTET